MTTERVGRDTTYSSIGAVLAQARARSNKTPVAGTGRRLAPPGSYDVAAKCRSKFPANFSTGHRAMPGSRSISNGETTSPATATSFSYSPPAMLRPTAVSIIDIGSDHATVSHSSVRFVQYG